MENMDIYFKDNAKKKRWETGQSILHRENRETAKEGQAQKTYGLRNSYGSLRYLNKDKKDPTQKEGFALEAFEAAGTPLHTEKEKHIDRASMKKISHGDKKTLFASELPLRNQAIFYEVSGSKKSNSFLKCMKELVRQRGHQTLQDAFGFLEQEPERLELEALKETRQELVPGTKSGNLEPLSQEEKKDRQDGLSLAEFDEKNKRIDSLGSRLLKKEAKERQLCSELQTMLTQHAKEKPSKERQLGTQAEHLPESREKQRDAKRKKASGSNQRRQIPSDNRAAQTPPAGGSATDSGEEFPTAAEEE